MKHYEGYQGRNPKTGQVIPVKPKRGLLFRTGKELRDRVNRAAAEERSPATGAASRRGSERLRVVAPAQRRGSCGPAGRTCRSGSSSA